VCTRSELWYLLQANPKAKVADPILGMITAINKYLQEYHMYKVGSLSRPKVRRLDTMSRDALATLLMKTAVKTKAKKTKNQASFGCSILKANIEVEAAIELAHDLDETGMPCVCRGVGLLGFFARFA
jgi:hypothetical protein